MNVIIPDNRRLIRLLSMSAGRPLPRGSPKVNGDAVPEASKDRDHFSGSQTPSTLKYCNGQNLALTITLT